MENVNKRRRIFLALSKLESGPQEINSKEIRPHFTFSVNWKKRDKVRKNGVFILKVTFFAAVFVVDAKALRLIYFAETNDHAIPFFVNVLDYCIRLL